MFSICRLSRTLHRLPRARRTSRPRQVVRGTEEVLLKPSVLRCSSLFSQARLLVPRTTAKGCKSGRNKYPKLSNRMAKPRIPFLFYQLLQIVRQSQSFLRPILGSHNHSTSCIANKARMIGCNTWTPLACTNAPIFDVYTIA